MAQMLQTMPETIRGWRRVTVMVNRWMALQTAGANWEINHEGNEDRLTQVNSRFSFHFCTLGSIASF